jgi:hypothetical protein
MNPDAEHRTSPGSRASRALRLVVDALRGRGASPTEGPLSSAILMLAIPMVLEMVMESVFAVVDIFFVSRLGSDEDRHRLRGARRTEVETGEAWP